MTPFKRFLFFSSGALLLIYTFALLAIPNLVDALNLVGVEQMLFFIGPPMIAVFGTLGLRFLDREYPHDLSPQALVGALLISFGLVTMFSLIRLPYFFGPTEFIGPLLWFGTPAFAALTWIAFAMERWIASRAN